MDRGANGWTDGGRTDGQTYMRTDVRTNLRSDGWTYQKKTEERTEGRGEQITFFENVLCIAKIIRMNDLSISQIFEGSIAGRSDNTEPFFQPRPIATRPRNWEGNVIDPSHLPNLMN